MINLDQARTLGNVGYLKGFGNADFLEGGQVAQDRMLPHPAFDLRIAEFVQLAEIPGRRRMADEEGIAPRHVFFTGWGTAIEDDQVVIPVAQAGRR